MYGLILEGIGDAVRRKFGDEIWEETRKKAGVPHHSFNMHKTYSETVIPRIAKAGSEVTGRPIDELMELCGFGFVAYVSPYGYDRVLRILGRHLRDLLNGLDNLHEYLRFSYPKLKPPSFFCENESRSGLTLHYRSKRRGFVYYVMGQLNQLAQTFYNLSLEIEVLSEEESMDMTHVIMKLHFDNSSFDTEQKLERDTAQLPVSSDLFFDTFPFHIVFSSGMNIMSIGTGLSAVMPYIVGQSVDEMFGLTRPLIEFTMENVLTHLNNVFEMMSVEAIRKTKPGSSALDDDDDDYDPDDKRRCLKLKGQMMFMEDWDAALFLGTPIMESLDKMFMTGLFINDLSMHDCSRDLVLAGTQQQAELKIAMDNEKSKSAKLESVLREMEAMDSKVSSLLNGFVPRTIATSINRKEDLSSYCMTYDPCTMLVSDISGFTQFMRGKPDTVFSTLNKMLTVFDNRTEKNKCYKIDSAGDAYVACCGAPVRTSNHAIYICDLAIDLLAACEEVGDPQGSDLKIKIGVMTGAMHGGVYGMRVPQFSLFGDVAMGTYKMAKAGVSGKAHISEDTKNACGGLPFNWEDGGTVDVKGKGGVKTFWLTGRSGGSCHEQVDETAEIEGNMPGFIPPVGQEPDLSAYYKPMM